MTLAAASPYIGAAILGALVGLVDILIRYKDAPWQALTQWASGWNIALNTILSVGAYCLLEMLEPLPPSAPARDQLLRVLLAGLAAISIFRTNLSVRFAGSDITIGMGRIIDGLLNNADQAIARARAEEKAADIRKIMSRVDFDRACGPLPLFCFGIIEVPAETQGIVGQQVRELKDVAGVSLATKSLLLGLIFQRVTGDGVLKEAVLALWTEIGDGGSPPSFT